jgi:predicted Ser/Thr protein kinase
VQHNDLEPRNVTQSSSGPLIIDFDRASLDHNCTGASCKELQQVAQALDLDPGERYLAYISLADLVA